MTFVTVRKIVFRIAGCWMLATASVAQAGEATTPGGMLCTDGMVTDPGTDDLDAIPVSAQMDGGCMAADGPVSI